MYAYITGKITSVNPKNIVVENNGIGYIIIVSNPYVFIPNSDITIFTHQVIKEDSNNIYGFKSFEEKELFLKLLSVNGIGPKSALSMLASGNVSGIIKAISARDDKFLKKFPGIGAKASQQIILDLAGKLNFDSKELNNIDLNSDTYEALKALGYKKKNIDKALASIDISLDTQNKIKNALRILTK